MIRRRELLDCTLRDGGYVNDWKFGHNVIKSTYKRLDMSGVEYIEVGFLDDRRPENMDYTIQPTTKAYDKLFVGVEKRNAIPVAMIDYGTCDISNISECKDSFIDGIRVIFKKEKIDEAIPFCEEIKRKGYKLFIQAISITAYSDLDILLYIQKINKVKPYAFSIVDTYGLLDNRSLTNYFNLFNNNLDSEIKIGYHAHNNFQLAFSNSIKFLALETDRTIVVDSTVYGMGKSAGNCASELIMMHMNEKYATNYNIDQVLDILDTDLMAIYQKCYWGYRYNFYISAMQKCHPNYVEFLLEKKTLSVSSINEILSKIPKEKKLLYDNTCIEELYVKYQSKIIDDTASICYLSEFVKNKEIVLLGPGSNVANQEASVKKYIDDVHALVIAVNFKPSQYNADFYFISNAKRYSSLINSMSIDISNNLILTSNISAFDSENAHIVNYESLLTSDTKLDNSLLLCLKLMSKLGVKKVGLAGFDGFSGKVEDYYDCTYAFVGNEEYQKDLNIILAEQIKKMGEDIEIHFLTESKYYGD